MRSDLRPGTAPSDRYPPAVGSSAADGELREVVGVPLELLLQAPWTGAVPPGEAARIRRPQRWHAGGPPWPPGRRRTMRPVAARRRSGSAPLATVAHRSVGRTAGTCRSCPPPSDATHPGRRSRRDGSPPTAHRRDLFLPGMSTRTVVSGRRVFRRAAWPDTSQTPGATDAPLGPTPTRPRPGCTPPRYPTRADRPRCSRVSFDGRGLPPGFPTLSRPATAHDPPPQPVGKARQRQACAVTPADGMGHRRPTITGRGCRPSATERHPYRAAGRAHANCASITRPRQGSPDRSRRCSRTTAPAVANSRCRLACRGPVLPSVGNLLRPHLRADALCGIRMHKDHGIRPRYRRLGRGPPPSRGGHHGATGTSPPGL